MEQTIDTCNDMDEIQMYEAKRKKPDSKSYILCNSIYITFQQRKTIEKENYRKRLPRIRAGGSF